MDFPDAQIARNDITLQTSLEDPTIDLEAVLQACSELYPYCVEAVVSQYTELFEFAAEECVLFAAIQFKRRPSEASEDKLQHGENLFTNQSDNAWTSSEASLSPPARDSTTNGNTPDDIDLEPVLRTVGILYLSTTIMVNELDIGISVLPQWRSKGIAAQALTAALEWAFATCNAHRVQALLMDAPSRDAARSIFTSLGFTCEGTSRRVAMSPALNGWRDVTYMAMLDTEWLLQQKHGERQPRTVWDEILARHHREQEEFLQVDDCRSKLRRTASMETVREGGGELALTSGPSSPSRSSVDPSEHEDETAYAWPSRTSSEASLSVPSRASSVASWSELGGSSSRAESVSSSTPMIKAPGRREKGKRRGKKPVAPFPDVGHGYVSDASSGWDMV